MCDRSFDLLVEKHVFGHKPGPSWTDSYEWPPHYCRDIRAAFEIVDKLKPDIFECLWHCDAGGWAILINDRSSIIRAPLTGAGMAWAISVAALRSKGVEVKL